MPDRRFFALPKAAPIKAGLSPETTASIERSIRKLPILGARNPDGVVVAELLIDDLTPSYPPDDGSDQGVPPSPVRLVIGLHPQDPCPPLVGDPTLDTILDDTPPVWWWTDPDWIEKELAVVNTLLHCQRMKQQRRAMRLHFTARRQRA